MSALPAASLLSRRRRALNEIKALLALGEDLALGGEQRRQLGAVGQVHAMW